MEDEQDLRWLYRRDFEGDMGKRSTSGGILDAIERGALVQMPGKSGDVSERALSAARRYGIVTAKVARCSTKTKAILAAAFGPTRYAGLDAYSPAYSPQTGVGYYSGVLLLLPEVVKLHRESKTSRILIDWLAHKGAVAKNEDGKTSAEDQAEALKTVAAIRAAMEQRITEALSEYGARVEESDAGTVTVRDIARATGLSHPTVSARLQEKRISWGRRGSRANEGAKVSREDLATLWPEAARALPTG